MTAARPSGKRPATGVRPAMGVRPSTSVRPTKGGRPMAPNGRAAILAVVLAAVVLSLAYPVREYIAQRRQIDQLRLQGAQVAREIRQLEAQSKRLREPAYIEQIARDRLHMCLPSQRCYVIIGTNAGYRSSVPASGFPWYARLWRSVQQADGS